VASADASQQRVTLMVDTRALSLSVVQGEEVLQVFDNIAIGSNGATWNKRQGDEKTPLGDFRITDVRQSDRFVVFIAIDYPNLDHAQRALQDKRISSDTYSAVKNAFALGKPPPQQTPLGGHIGIHGLGSGDPEVHSSFNWTNGCIAVTNEQLGELLSWVHPGTRVLIR
jgi:murein L,D-transpeptidase YafK